MITVQAPSEPACQHISDLGSGKEDISSVKWRWQLNKTKALVICTVEIKKCWPPQVKIWTNVDKEVKEDGKTSNKSIKLQKTHSFNMSKIKYGQHIFLPIDE